eukprot:49827-Alexandrium_andersonii.AAC.1
MLSHSSIGFREEAPHVALSERSRPQHGAHREAAPTGLKEPLGEGGGLLTDASAMGRRPVL